MSSVSEIKTSLIVSTVQRIRIFDEMYFVLLVRKIIRVFLFAFESTIIKRHYEYLDGRRSHSASFSHLLHFVSR